MAEIHDPALNRMSEVVRALVDIMKHGNLPAVDFQDERAVLGDDGGLGAIGIGEASGPAGPARGKRAAELAALDLMRQLKAGEN